MAIISAWNTIFKKRGNCDVKEIRDQLLKPNIISRLLYMTNVPKPTSNFCRSFQQHVFHFSCGSWNVLDVKEKLCSYKTKSQEQRFYFGPKAK